MREIKFRGKRNSDGVWVYGFYLASSGLHMIHDGASYEMVDPETVGQFTGLKDRNGKEIYEGDIFGNIKALRCVVERQANGAYELVFLDKRMKTWSIVDPRVQKSEVIGNIHDNPEMLPKEGEKRDG